jgi:hypothetical protein
MRGWFKLAFIKLVLAHSHLRMNALNQRVILINWRITPPIDQFHTWMTWGAGLISTSFSSNSKAYNFHFAILLTHLPIVVTLPELVLSRLIAHDTFAHPCTLQAFASRVSLSMLPLPCHLQKARSRPCSNRPQCSFKRSRWHRRNKFP